ncbi:protein disulfide-isomerase TMX3-like [Babylonia areolata]|uniref:protein disulfide-isomerase TMX3-like n=1 Tax=Babylonia areolata TaxID=304850 RepID=UPI003FD64F47
MAPSLNTVAVLLAVLLPICWAQIELDDRFLEKEKTGDMWLIEFYAPWCGHCKRLDPIYKEVAKKLRGTSVSVGKVDVTKHSDMAKHYQIGGFPTIKFIKGDNVYTHTGDQTKNAILQFVDRAQKPPVQWLSSTGKFLETKSLHSDEVFFIYVGEQQSGLYEKYYAAADSMLIQGSFYGGKKRVVEDLRTEREPAILVFKDKVFYEYLPRENEEVSKDSIETWMRSERHTAFPEASARTLFQLVDSKKYLVLVVIDPSVHVRMDVNNRLKQVARNVALNQREKYHRDFQFVWMAEPEMAESMTSKALSAPSLFVLQAATREFYIPPFHPYNVTLHSFEEYLDGITNGSVPAHGGTGFFQRLKRIRDDIWHFLTSTWKTSPWVVILILVVPSSILGVVVWSMWGRESMEDAYLRALMEMEKKAAQDLKQENVWPDPQADGEKAEPAEEESAEKQDEKPAAAAAAAAERDNEKKKKEENVVETNTKGEEGKKDRCSKPKGKEEKKND